MRKVYKLRQGRVIDGVCGGLAQYFAVDAIWVRIAWAALALAGGIGILAYFFAMYLFPRAEEGTEARPDSTRSKGMLVSGILLVAVGVLIALRVFRVLTYDFGGAWSVAFNVLWPLCLIGGGAFLLFVYWRERSEMQMSMRRAREDRMLLGVCAGMGNYLNVDPAIVRLIFALVIVLSRGIGLIVYVLIALLTPELEEDSGTGSS